MTRILIADDNKLNADLLEAHLDGAGFETKTAASGDDTPALASSWKPDIVLLDVMMPKLSGFEICKRLRAAPDTQAIGILMVTALDQATDVERAVDVGTDDFITKPINKTELLIRVRALLEAKKEASAVERGLRYFGLVQQGL